MRLHALLLFLGSLQGAMAQFALTVEEEDDSGETEQTPQPTSGAETYWSGTAPICLGGCRGRHQELTTDRCGDSQCCWIGLKSLCRVSCGQPGVDVNGLVYGDEWWVGSVVRYACRPGFRLIGPSVRSCQADGVWTPKPYCLRMCTRKRIEISEKELTATCSSTCEDKSYYGVPKQGCALISNCRKKETGWKRFFARCAPCLCDCAITCASAG